MISSFLYILNRYNISTNNFIKEIRRILIYYLNAQALSLKYIYIYNTESASIVIN